MLDGSKKIVLVPDDKLPAKEFSFLTNEDFSSNLTIDDEVDEALIDDLISDFEQPIIFSNAMIAAETRATEAPPSTIQDKADNLPKNMFKI